MQIPYTIKERKGKYKKDLQILCIKTGVRKPGRRSDLSKNLVAFAPAGAKKV